MLYENFLKFYFRFGMKKSIFCVPRIKYEEIVTMVLEESQWWLAQIPFCFICKYLYIPGLNNNVNAPGPIFEGALALDCIRIVLANRFSYSHQSLKRAARPTIAFASITKANQSRERKPTLTLAQPWYIHIFFFWIELNAFEQERTHLLECSVFSFRLRLNITVK